MVTSGNSSEGPLLFRCSRSHERLQCFAAFAQVFAMESQDVSPRPIPVLEEVQASALNRFVVLWLSRQPDARQKASPAARPENDEVVPLPAPGYPHVALAVVGADRVVVQGIAEKLDASVQQREGVLFPYPVVPVAAVVRRIVVTGCLIIVVFFQQAEVSEFVGRYRLGVDTVGIQTSSASTS